MRVALRDASGYRTHRHTTGSTYSHVPVFHAIKPDEPYLSACGRPIDTASEQGSSGVIYRCGRPGCRQAFAADERRKGSRDA
ncbi:MAG TPA: hypothetical protein VNC18_07370 [Gemmatimonadaceae bacterium]|jgi:hypothetical protein|nr:hypothetical protein [Gemmatimonadaceae bacterium]